MPSIFGMITALGILVIPLGKWWFERRQVNLGNKMILYQPWVQLSVWNGDRIQSCPFLNMPRPSCIVGLVGGLGACHICRSDHRWRSHRSKAGLVIPLCYSIGRLTIRLVSLILLVWRVGLCSVWHNISFSFIPLVGYLFSYINVLNLTRLDCILNHFSSCNYVNKNSSSVTHYSTIIRILEGADKKLCCFLFSHRWLDLGC